MKNYLKMFLLACFAIISVAYAQDEVASVPASAEPVFTVIGTVLIYINQLFPKAGPWIQLTLEVLSSIAMFFTLATVFVVGCLKLPIVVLRVKGAHEKADKIQKFSDKISPWLMKLSMFNAPKK